MRHSPFFARVQTPELLAGHEEDAPALEKDLHHRFHEMRLNKVNFRKEFFRIPLQTVRKTLQASGVEASFTMLAEAREFRETQAIEQMTPEERKKYFEQ